ncbi:MAG: T9SS type A sorting domain-containing protein, partial [Chitinophagales bacterium]|nr:T9SS type A sorting domain-containing protein [Chitinophagales bacterium]
NNFYGNLGDNTVINKPIPVKALSVVGIGNLDLIQCNSFSSIPTVLSTTYTSQHSDTDGTGWRHYCTVDNQLLLSLKIGASGAVVSDDSVRLKLAATTTMSSTSFGGMITNVNGYSIFERRWDVKPTTQPSSAVGIKYYFTPKEYSDIVVALANLPSPSTFTNVNQLTMYKATSGTPFADPHTVPGVLLKNGTIPNSTRWKYAPHGNCNHSAEYNVASFSGGGGGGGGGGDTTSALLPVELLSFKGHWSEDDAILTWVTASERNSDRFEVERSVDGINFTKVGTVKSNGNSTEVLTYMFNDADAGQAKVDGYYYRLKQIDYNGEFDYAQIIYLSIDKIQVDAKVIVFPNPFVNELQVVMPTSSNSDVQIQISGVHGAMMMNYLDKVDRDRRVKINTKLLPAGVFILNVTQDGITSSHKIIKEW